MKQILLLTTCALLLSCSPQGESAGAVIPASETAQIDPILAEFIETARNGRHGYDIIEGLTTEIGPRLAGTISEARARAWTVAKFQEIGLQNVRVEEFELEGWVRGVETARLQAPYEQNLYITALGGSVATPEGGVSAELVEFPTFDALKESDADLTGKIAYIGGRMVKAPDGAGYGPANRKRRSGATEAGKRGALAVVIRSVGTDSRRFPHTGQMRYSDEVTPIPIGALSAPDADQLERLFDRGQTLTLDLNLQPRSVGKAISGNVIGDIVGSTRPEEIVLIGGHLDSWDQGTGAVDDAAGVGIAAGAAQVIIESGQVPERTIRVVAFGAEEVGLLGGFAYVEAHKDTDLDNHVLASESDFGAGPFYEIKSGVRSGEDVIARMAEVLEVPMSDAPTNGGPDIGPMFAEGVPAMRLQQDGTDYFDLHHTPDDTFDKIDPEEVAQNVAGFAVMSWIAANADTDFR